MVRYACAMGTRMTDEELDEIEEELVGDGFLPGFARDGITLLVAEVRRLREEIETMKVEYCASGYCV